MLRIAALHNPAQRAAHLFVLGVQTPVRLLQHDTARLLVLSGLPWAAWLKEQHTCLCWACSKHLCSTPCGTPACAGRGQPASSPEHKAVYLLVLRGAALGSLAKRQHQALQGQLQHVDVLLLIPHNVTQHWETLRSHSRLGLQRGIGNADAHKYAAGNISDRAPQLARTT